jgi:hypothetical protein
LSDLAGYLASLSANTAEEPHRIVFSAGEVVPESSRAGYPQDHILYTALDANPTKYVFLDFSLMSAANAPLDFWVGTDQVSMATANHINRVLRNTTHVIGVSLPHDLSTMLYTFRFHESNETTTNGIREIVIPASVISITYSPVYNSNITKITIMGENTPVFDAPGGTATADLFKTVYTSYAQGSRAGVYQFNGSKWEKIEDF